MTRAEYKVYADKSNTEALITASKMSRMSEWELADWEQEVAETEQRIAREREWELEVLCKW